MQVCVAVWCSVCAVVSFVLPSVLRVLYTSPPSCCLSFSPQSRLGVGYKLNRLRGRMTGKRGLGQVFQMNRVWDALAKRLILSQEYKRLSESARAEFRKVRRRYVTRALLMRCHSPLGQTMLWVNSV